MKYFVSNSKKNLRNLSTSEPRILKSLMEKSEFDEEHSPRSKKWRDSSCS